MPGRFRAGEHGVVAHVSRGRSAREAASRAHHSPTSRSASRRCRPRRALGDRHARTVEPPRRPTNVRTPHASEVDASSHRTARIRVDAGEQVQGERQIFALDIGRGFHPPQRFVRRPRPSSGPRHQHGIAPTNDVPVGEHARPGEICRNDPGNDVPVTDDILDHARILERRGAEAGREEEHGIRRVCGRRRRVGVRVRPNGADRMLVGLSRGRRMTAHELRPVFLASLSRHPLRRLRSRRRRRRIPNPHDDLPVPGRVVRIDSGLIRPLELSSSDRVLPGRRRQRTLSVDSSGGRRDGHRSREESDEPPMSQTGQQGLLLLTQDVDSERRRSELARRERMDLD